MWIKGIDFMSSPTEPSLQTLILLSSYHLCYALTVLVFTLIWGSLLSSFTIVMEILAQAQGWDAQAPVFFHSVTCYAGFILHCPLLLVTASAWVSARPSPATPLFLSPVPLLIQVSFLSCFCNSSPPPRRSKFNHLASVVSTKEGKMKPDG